MNSKPSSKKTGQGSRRSCHGSAEERREKAEQILRLIAQGKSQLQACKEIGVPDATFDDWTSKDAELAGKYARAREDRGGVLVEQALEIADDPTIDPAHKRIMVDTRKWFASKLDAKRYGDKVDLNHGGQAENPLNITVIERRIVKMPQPEDAQS